MKQSAKRFSFLLLAIVLSFFYGPCGLFTPRGNGQTVEDCQMCHGDEGLTKVDSTGKEISLFVDESVFENSIHNSLGCTGCHSGVKAEPHETLPEPVKCGACHTEAQKLYQKGIHGQKRLEGVANAPTCGGCHGSHNIRTVDDPEALVYRGNQPQMCARCHEDIRLVTKYPIPAPTPYQAYQQSVHGKALKEDNLGVAVCSDCHGAHDLRPASDPNSTVFRTNVPSTCGACHPIVEEEYSQDAHGKALKDGAKDAPVCTDCHSAHAIKSSSDETSSTFPANLSKITCTYCHSTEVISGKYNYVTTRITPYPDMYHSAGSMAGDTTAASCVSCHTSHNIRPPDDPLSSVNKTNLPQTCGRCHPGAGPNFAKGSVHIAPTSKKDIGVWWVRRIYILLIIVTIGGMAAHNGVIMIRYFRERYREAKEGRVVRWTNTEVMWHLLLFLSFVTLIITGFAYKYPGTWWSSWLTSSPSAFVARGVAHRVAGVLLIGLFCFSIFRGIFTQRGREQLKAKLPVPSDIKNLISNLLFSLGLSSRRPQFDRYDYSEKAEYWALIWGGFVMTITGIPLWFETFFLKFIPKWLLDVAMAIHLYEAWLATLAILVWHFFYMFLHPENYPINFTAITGTMTEEAYMERHPLDYDRMIARGELIKEESQERLERTEGSKKTD